MRHVFVETNWLVDYAAPAHHHWPNAGALLARATAGEIRLCLPAVCLAEARETIPRKFPPKRESGPTHGERLRARGERDVCFCELDSDLQPWDKNENPKPELQRLYDAAGVWVYGDYTLEWPKLPPGLAP